MKAGISTLPFLAVLMALVHRCFDGNLLVSLALVFVAGTAEGWDGPDAGPVQCLRSPDAPGLRAWLSELSDVLSAGCSPSSPCSSPSSALSSPSLEASMISALYPTHPSSPPCLFSLLRRCDFTFSLAFSSLFPISPALPLPCYFSLYLRCDWLAICVHQSPASLHRHCHVWALAHTLSSYLLLGSAHIFGNLNLWSAGIMGCHCCGLQDCQPFSTQCVTDRAKAEKQGEKAYFLYNMHPFLMFEFDELNMKTVLQSLCRDSCWSSI